MTDDPDHEAGLRAAASERSWAGVLDLVTAGLDSGRGHVLLVTGERGSGRSRHAMILVDRVRQRHDAVIVGHRGLTEGTAAATSWSAPAHPTPGSGVAARILGPEHAPASVASVPLSVVRSVARVRPGGPAARFMEDLAADVPVPAFADDPDEGPGGQVPAGLSVWLPTDLRVTVPAERAPRPERDLPEPVVGRSDMEEPDVEELCLVLVTEAARHPLAILVEDVHLAGDATNTFLDHLSSVVGTVPLLVVLTAATGWAAGRPGGRAWRGLLGRHGVLHLPVPAVSRSELLAAVGQVCRERLREDHLEEVLEACEGNPRIAQEMASWTLEGCPPDAAHCTSLVPELVAAHERHEILGALAVSGEPTGARPLAATTSTSVAQVRAVLDAAQRAGIVRAVVPDGDVHAFRHPVYAAAARGLLGPGRLPELHLATATALIAAGVRPGADEHAVAVHLVASGHPRSDTASWCLRAARWNLSVGRLREAAWIAAPGLDVAADDAVRVELAVLLAQAQRRLGDHRAAACTLREALRLAGDTPDAARLAVELLELEPATPVPGADRLAEQVRATCPPDRSDLQVRLAVVEASRAVTQDPVTGRRLAERALRSEGADEPTARARALVVAARASMDHTHVPSLEILSRRLLREPGTEGLAATASVALASADRARLESVLREYDWRERSVPDRAVRDELTLLGAVLAVLDGRRSDLLRALLELSASTSSPRVGTAVALLPYLWSASTRSTSPVPAPAVPPADELDDVVWLARTALRTSPLTAVEHELVRERLGPPDRLARPRGDGTTGARLALAGLFAAAERDLGTCEAVAEAFAPHVEQFVVLWPFLPVGPVGWFLAGPQRVLGRRREAVAALEAAQAASQGLGAPGWALRAAAALARAAPGDTASVPELVGSTIGPVRARRFRGVVAEIRFGPAVAPDDDGFGLGPGAAGHDPVGSDPAGPDPLGPDPAGSGTPRSDAARSDAARSDAARSDAARFDAGFDAGFAAGADPDGGPRPQLTVRESEIMSLAATGCTNREIARRLFLSVATVERHCTNLYRRLGVRNRAQALAIIGGRLPVDPQR